MHNKIENKRTVHAILDFVFCWTLTFLSLYEKGKKEIIFGGRKRPGKLSLRNDY
jgi:hypothetical protein